MEEFSYMLNQYYTVKQSGEHEIVIQKSKFIGYVQRVHTEGDATTFIQGLKKQHYNATHNCSAYIIGDNDQIQKANDDGEPSGTAGIPMLEVLKRLKLKNTAVVVTRYFGGIKLGAGGLIRAYSSTTSETIKKIGIVKGELMQGISITINYPLLGRVENALHQSPHIIDEINYLETVELIVYVHIHEVETFKSEIINLTNNQVRIQLTDKKYIESEVPSAP